MSFTRIPFPAMDWTPGAFTALERKKADAAHGVTMLELAPGFIDPSWCRNPHIGLVLAGELAFELEDGEESLRAGEAFVLAAGAAHRARNPGEATCIVFIVTPTP